MREENPKCPGCGREILPGSTIRYNKEGIVYHSGCLPYEDLADWYKWEYYLDPIDKGWYAVVYCWDIEEGSIMISMYWNGKNWDDDHAVKLPIQGFYNSKFKDEYEADKWIEENDWA